MLVLGYQTGALYSQNIYPQNTAGNSSNSFTTANSKSSHGTFRYN